jgi:pimeloyl-ACP methyl ester carboxylesterase
VSVPPTARQLLGVKQPYARCEVDGVALAYRQLGQGRDIICLHAIGHGGGDFDAVADALAQRHRVTIIDWPGHGFSGDDTKPPGVVRFGEVLAGFIEAQQLANVVLIGNSVGGGAAIHYAHRAPNNVAALVLANPAGLVEPTPRTQRATAMMAKFFAAGVARKWWFTPLFAIYYRFMLPRPAANARRRAIIAARFEIAPLLTKAWCGFADPSSDLRPAAAALKCPVLFTWAMRDRFVSYRICRDAIRAVPNATVEKFDAGHTPFLETPEEFLAAVTRFLDGPERLAAVS